MKINGAKLAGALRARHVKLCLCFSKTAFIAPQNICLFVEEMSSSVRFGSGMAIKLCSSETSVLSQELTKNKTFKDLIQLDVSYIIDTRQALLQNTKIKPVCWL